MNIRVVLLLCSHTPTIKYDRKLRRGGWYHTRSSGMLEKCRNDHSVTYCRLHLPTRGLSEVIGMIAETVLRNIVSDRRIVTPAIAISKISKIHIKLKLRVKY